MKIWPTTRGWKRLVIGLAILLGLGLLVNGALAWRAEWQLQSRLVALRAAGHPASIADLAPPSIPDDENAAAILERIGSRLEEFGRECGGFYDMPLGKAYQEARDAGNPPSPEQIDALRAILDKYPDVQQALVDASQRDQYASRIDFSLGHTAFIERVVDHQQLARTASRFLNWRGEVLLANDWHEQAVECGLASLRLARMHDHEPTMVASLVAIAMRGVAYEQLYDALSVGRIQPDLYVKIDEELARHDNPQRLVRMLIAERAVGARWFQSHLSRKNSALAHMIGWPIKSQQIGVLDAMHDYVQLAERPWHEVRDTLGSTDGPLPPTGHGVMADLLLPAIKASFQAHARSLAVSRSLRIYNALRRFADEHGRDAARLDDLNLPPEAKMDPYTNAPLKLKFTDHGWVIYSVMANGIDDDGDFRDQKDYGVAPRKVRAKK